MRTYDLTVTTPSGFTFTQTGKSEQSRRSLTEFFQGYGDTVSSVETGWISDRPAYVQTESGDLVRNV